MKAEMCPTMNSSAFPEPANPISVLASPRARTRPDGSLRCDYCDDTGDVHSIIGDWLGICTCEEGAKLRSELQEARDRRSRNET